VLDMISGKKASNVKTIFDEVVLLSEQLGDIVGHVTQVEAEGGGRAGEDVRREEGRRGDVGRPSRELHEAAFHRRGTVSS
jgi:hypothetical protein